jgi:choline dehydrogenase-like flavoprotein
MAVCEHWNYEDRKDFFGGYAFLSQGPLPIDYAKTLATGRGLWGMELRREMTRYNHMAGLKIVGEVESRAVNRVELADEKDALGLPVARVVFSYSENDKKLKQHALDYMQVMLEAAGAHDVYRTGGSAHLMGGCPMGDDPRTSVTDPLGRTWEIPNLWICDGSLMPTGGGVNPSLTIMANAARIADGIALLARRGEL